MISKLNDLAIEELLNESVIGRLGCSDGGFTYVVPISYAYDGENIYGHTHEGMKLELMRKNPEVCFEVDNTTDMANWKSVIAWGTFEELKQDQEKERALSLLLQRRLPIASSNTTHLGPEWPFNSTTAEIQKEAGGVFFRIHLNDKTGRFETSQNYFKY